MVKLKEILNYREIEMMQHFQNNMLNADIEDLETIEMYQNEIMKLLNKAKERYYEENPSVFPLKSLKTKESDSLRKMTLKARELLTKEEEEEVNFLRWRITKSFTPWGIKQKKNRVNAILKEALKRNGYDPSIFDN